jgi:hypothetical protein
MTAFSPQLNVPGREILLFIGIQWSDHYTAFVISFS